MLGFFFLNAFYENFAIHLAIIKFFKALEEVSKHRWSMLRSEWLQGRQMGS